MFLTKFIFTYYIAKNIFYPKLSILQNFFILSRYLFYIFFKSSDFFSSFLLSTIDCLKVFSYSKIITLIQSRFLVYRIFNFDMYSFVIIIARDINKAVLGEMIPAPGLIKPLLNYLLLILTQSKFQ